MASGPLKTIGIREFREKLAEHISSDTPLAITRHGFTVGYYRPAHRPISETDRQALEDATQRFHELLEAHGIDPEDLIQDYKALRRARQQSTASSPGLSLGPPGSSVASGAGLESGVPR